MFSRLRCHGILSTNVAKQDRARGATDGEAVRGQGIDPAADGIGGGGHRARRAGRRHRRPGIRGEGRHDGHRAGRLLDPGPFFDLGHTTVFFASDGIHGRELWRSDGTDAGTVLVKDVAPGPADGVTTIGHAADGVLYFPGAAGGLWRSDGTAAGTSRLADLTPWRIIAGGNRLYVAVLVDYESVDLFRIDLPSGATTSLGSSGDQIEPSLTLVGGRLFFAADAGTEGSGPATARRRAPASCAPLNSPTAKAATTRRS